MRANRDAPICQVNSGEEGRVWMHLNRTGFGKEYHFCGGQSRSAPRREEMWNARRLMPSFKRRRYDISVEETSFDSVFTSLSLKPCLQKNSFPIKWRGGMLSGILNWVQLKGCQHSLIFVCGSWRNTLYGEENQILGIHGKARGLSWDRFDS